jgi:hypothetical protein
VYRHCIFCRADLGTNDELPFAVGKRLAFDEARGRLWVICQTCARWNLSPLEERWEAIEAAERLYRATHRRVATDNIGMARIGDTVELVRIGAPLRPEFAAWRYGAEFLKRRTKALVFQAVDAVATLGALALSGVSVGLWGVIGSKGGVGGMARNYLERRRGGRLLILPDQTVARIFSFSAGGSRLRRELDGSVSLELRYDERIPNAGLRRVLTGPHRYAEGRRARLHDELMLPALRLLLPFANGDGAKKQVVEDAVYRLDREGDVRAVLNSAIPTTAGRWSSPDRELGKVDAASRLALEMALHEGDERAAAEGELQALHDRWREAEEIASIADDLFVPTSVRERLEELGGGRAR